MPAARERLELRVQADKKAKIARAATTAVPTEFFDDMLAALDKPAAPAPALVEAMRRSRDLVAQEYVDHTFPTAPYNSSP